MSSVCFLCGAPPIDYLGCHATCDPCSKNVILQRLHTMLLQLEKDPDAATGVFDTRCYDKCPLSRCLPPHKVQVYVEAVLACNPAASALQQVYAQVPAYFCGKFTKFLYCAGCRELTAFYGAQPGYCWNCNEEITLSVSDKLRMEFVLKSFELMAPVSAECSEDNMNFASDGNLSQGEVKQNTQLCGSPVENPIVYFQTALSQLFRGSPVEMQSVQELTDSEHPALCREDKQSQFYFVHPGRGSHKAKRFKLIKRPTRKVLVIEVPEDSSEVTLSRGQITFNRTSQYRLRCIITLQDNH